jgi:hypothetical protein
MARGLNNPQSITGVGLASVRNFGDCINRQVAKLFHISQSGKAWNVDASRWPRVMSTRGTVDEVDHRKGLG